MLHATETSSSDNAYAVTANAHAKVGNAGVRVPYRRSRAATSASAPAPASASASKSKATFAAGAVALAAALLAAGDAHAHSGSITHSTVTVSPDQREVAYRLLLSPVDAAEAIGLGADVDPSDDQVAAGRARLIDYVLEDIAVKSAVGDDERACPVTDRRAGVVHDGGRFVEVAWTARCDAPIEVLVVEYELFFDLDPRHQGLVAVSYGDVHPVKVFRPGLGRLVWELGAPAPPFWADFIHLGVEHIVLGYDHVAFLLGLLLVIAIARGADGALERRGLVSGIRYTAGIVTSFTVAHSLTLIAASMGWIELPSRPVEIVIAASIAYIAVENIVKPDVSYRYLVTFGFGLIHGLGFASVLAELLPPSNVLLPLLMFNVGVELGQLAIVIAVLPVLALAARRLGAARYRDWVINVGSALLALSGVLWLVERVFEVTILPL